jgi:hypothetical protein
MYLLEISARTGFTDAFTHLSENTARADNLNTSLCAVLLSGACNTGPEPLVHHDIPALRRDRYPGSIKTTSATKP